MKHKLIERYNWMKNIRFLMLIVIIIANLNQTYSQTTTAQLKRNIKVSNVTVLQFVDKLGTDFKNSFFIVDEEIGKTVISVDLKNATINEILENAFQSKDIAYVIKNRSITISLKSKKNSKNAEPQITTKTKIVSGVVLDEKGQPVIGASVIIPGTTIGVATDINGHFTLEAPSNAKLRISYIGYDAKEELLNSSDNLKIKLEPTPQVLNELVITAQALGQKNAILKQISSNTLKNVISAEKLQQNPDANTIEAIGRLPGISVNRSGGEGAGFLLRGLDQSYSKVLINGEPLAVGLNAISTYALQGVEVYKTLTANQEGNAVAGSIDLTLRETPKGLHYSIMAQSGYNALNKDFGNYNFVGLVSNRFLNDKLGVFLSVSADKTNRSTNLISVGYNTNYTTNLNDPFYISNINFNLNERINYKQSAVLTLDYIASKSTTLNFQSFLSASNFYSSNHSKNFNPEGNSSTVAIRVSMSEIPEYRNFGSTNNFSGRTKMKFLQAILNYGLSYTYNKTVTPGSRNWSYTSETRADGLDRDSLKTFAPAQVANKFDQILSNLTSTKLESMSYDQTQANNSSISPRMDIEIPFGTKSGFLQGKIQFGTKYRLSHNSLDRTVGVGYAGNNAIFGDFIKNEFNWPSGIVELEVDGQENNFMGGSYSFGDRYSFTRNNQVFDAWQKNGNEKYLAGSTGGLGDDPKYSGFVYDLNSSAMNDLNITTKYSAAYIMPEIIIGKWFMIMPGVRLENEKTEMHARKGSEVTRAYSVFENIDTAFGLKDTLAIREDRFILPMLHFRFKPVKWFYTHFSYTHTIRRPSAGVSPFEYYNAQDASNFSFTSGNPNLKTELWKSYDLQITFHTPKLGLFSVTGFNKTVQDKLWSRSYKRIPGEPIPNLVFKDNDLVNMTVYENHPYPILLQGIEAEWQTSFGYLPKPFSYLTLSVNYTYTHGNSPNPYTRLYKYKPEGSRYELTGRKDSVVIEPMTGIPTHVANITLGIEIKNFKSYLSYQYSSQKIQQTHPNDLRLYVIAEPYSRLDFNASYGFNLKRKAVLEIMLKAANLTNSEDRIRYRDEKRPISIEQYGITADLGVRYKF